MGNAKRSKKLREMDDLLGNLSHISCLLCGGFFLYPGPGYPVHLYTCHGVMEDSHRAYLVKVTEFKMKRGELPQINPEEDTSNYSTNANVDKSNKANVDEIEREDRKGFVTPDVNDGDISSVRRVQLTMRNPYMMKLPQPIIKYPRMNVPIITYPRNGRAPSTPRRKWDGEDDKTRDPDFILGKKRSRSNSTSNKSVNRSVDNITLGKRSGSSSIKKVNFSLDDITIRQKLPCETCGGHYASRQSLQKHQRKVCKKHPLYQGHAPG